MGNIILFNKAIIRSDKKHGSIIKNCQMIKTFNKMVFLNHRFWYRLYVIIVIYKINFNVLNNFHFIRNGLMLALGVAI